jgi:hypothetical protein
MRRIAIFALCAAACATGPRPIVLPGNLAVPESSSERFSANAQGTQNYTCREKQNAPGSFEWGFVGPEADLFDDGGRKLGTHFAGPTWQLDDGSKVVAAVKEKAPSPPSIPWLLLEVKSSEGQGRLTGVTFIQRLDTSGGAPPEGGCDAAHAGEVRKVAYRAMYRFFAPR